MADAHVDLGVTRSGTEISPVTSQVPSLSSTIVPNCAQPLAPLDECIKIRLYCAHRTALHGLISHNRAIPIVKPPKVSIFFPIIGKRTLPVYYDERTW